MTQQTSSFSALSELARIRDLIDEALASVVQGKRRMARAVRRR